MIVAERAARVETEALAARATAVSSVTVIARLKLEIEKLRRELHGCRLEHKTRLLEQKDRAARRRA